MANSVTERVNAREKNFTAFGFEQKVFGTFSFVPVPVCVSDFFFFAQGAGE